MQLRENEFINVINIWGVQVLPRYKYKTHAQRSAIITRIAHLCGLYTQIGIAERTAINTTERKGYI